MAKWKREADAFKVKAGALKSQGGGGANGLDKKMETTQTQTEPGADNKSLAKSGTNSVNYDDLHKKPSA